MLRSLMSMPSLSKSPWMLGATQATLASAIWRTSALTSAKTSLSGYAKAWAARGVPEVGELLSKCEVFECQLRASVEDGTRRYKEAHEQGDHGWIMHQVGSHRLPIVATVEKQAARMKCPNEVRLSGLLVTFQLRHLQQHQLPPLPDDGWP